MKTPESTDRRIGGELSDSQDRSAAAGEAEPEGEGEAEAAAEGEGDFGFNCPSMLCNIDMHSYPLTVLFGPGRDMMKVSSHLSCSCAILLLWSFSGCKSTSATGR